MTPHVKKHFAAVIAGGPVAAQRKQPYDESYRRMDEWGMWISTVVGVVVAVLLVVTITKLSKK